MISLQELVYNVEEGFLRGLLTKVALGLLTIGLVAWIGISEFNGLKTPEAMDLAQQARQIATGQGLTTLLIRPLALWQVRAQFGNDAPEVSRFPETLSPPLYPLILAGAFRLGEVSGVARMSVSTDAIKGMRVYPPDYIVLGLNLICVVLTILAVYLWAAGQFDAGSGILAAVFCLGSTALWNQAVAGGSTCPLIMLYAWSGYFFYRGLAQEDQSEEVPVGGGLWFGLAGFTIGLTPLIQMIHIWPALAVVSCGLALFQRGRVGDGCRLQATWRRDRRRRGDDPRHRPLGYHRAHAVGRRDRRCPPGPRRLRSRSLRGCHPPAPHRALPCLPCGRRGEGGIAARLARGLGPRGRLWRGDRSGGARA